jgi:hypothetical protein
MRRRANDRRRLGEGRFGKQDFRYVAEEDDYVCPAGEQLAHHYATEENGLVLRRYWTNACQSCAIRVSSICRAMRLGSSATDVGETRATPRREGPPIALQETWSLNEKSDATILFPSGAAA